MERKNNDATNPASDTPNTSGIPEKSNTKPMDSKQDVEKSNDAKTDQDFPGYPHYPAKEDMMDQRTDNHRVDVDVENLPGSRNATNMDQRFSNGQNTDKPVGADLGLRTGTEGDVTPDDLLALNATDNEMGRPQNVHMEDDLNTDLDVPGSELDDELDAIGDGDEENNYYSLGGDRHESQEEDPQSGPVRDTD